MTLFLDTEFNGFGGNLISIALVSDYGRKGDEFYAMRALPDSPTPFVREHVLPVLGAKSLSDAVLQKRLLNYLHRHKGELIVMDWYEDLTHFLNLLATDPGWAYRLDLSFRLINPGEPLQSKVPHNALSDAHALMRWYLGRKP